MTPHEAELLRQQLQDTNGQLVQTREELARANQEIKLLREKIDALVRRLFGAKSEKLDPEQLLLLLQGMESPGKARGRGGPTALDGPIASA